VLFGAAAGNLSLLHRFFAGKVGDSDGRELVRWA
jgi:hypothetical protein